MKKLKTLLILLPCVLALLVFAGLLYSRHEAIRHMDTYSGQPPEERVSVRLSFLTMGDKQFTFVPQWVFVYRNKLGVEDVSYVDLGHKIISGMLE